MWVVKVWYLVFGTGWAAWDSPHEIVFSISNERGMRGQRGPTLIDRKTADLRPRGMERKRMEKREGGEGNKICNELKQK